jgi:hypothetical protein
MNINKWIIKLSRPSICVFVKPIQQGKWEGYYHTDEKTWFPIIPIREGLKAPKEFGTEKKFYRIQIPLTSAFSMSDYKVSIMKFDIKINRIGIR